MCSAETFGPSTDFDTHVSGTFHELAELNCLMPPGIGGNDVSMYMTQLLFRNQLHRLMVLSGFFFAIACQKPAPNHIRTPEGKSIQEADLRDFLSAQMDQYEVPGLALGVINGETIFQETLGRISLEGNVPIDSSSIFEAASLSKVVFAFFVMKQVEKGLIQLDTPLYRYVAYPDIEHDERYKLITPRMVLSHTTGLPNWRKGQLDIQFTPGTKYLYSGEGFQYLARALAAVNNVDRDGLFEIFRREIAVPLGAERFYFDWNQEVARHKVNGHKAGEVGANGPSDFRTKEFGSAHNLHTDIRSYVHFVQALATGKHLVPELYREMLQAQVEIPTDDYESAVLGTSHWSLGLGVRDTPHGPMYTHGGNNGYFTAFMLFYPDKEFGLVLLSNSEKIMFSNFTNEIAAYLDTDLRMDMDALQKILAQYE
ncbi:MAG: serine hydrolase domain-containing protein [Bacteroidota bacterium]